jgi:hypothetical protein
MVGVVGALLFGNVTGARADTTAEPPTAEPTTGSTTSDPGIANHTVTFRPRTDPSLPDIRCRLDVNVPYAVEWSNVETYVEVVCSEKVEFIDLTGDLWRLSSLIEREDVEEEDAFHVSTFVRASCVKGIWHAEADAGVVVDSRYTPRSAQLWDVTGDRTLNIDSNCRSVPPCPDPVPKCREP